MGIEEEYQDVLQNIEFTAVEVYREHRELSDYNVMHVYDALIDSYFADKFGRKPKDFGLSDLERELFDSIQRMCEWRLGRADLDDEETEEERPLPITVDTVILCLKKVLKSARTWNRRRGRQGYLDFVGEFIR